MGTGHRPCLLDDASIVLRCASGICYGFATGAMPMCGIYGVCDFSMAFSFGSGDEEIRRWFYV